MNSSQLEAVQMTIEVLKHCVSQLEQEVQHLSSSPAPPRQLSPPVPPEGIVIVPLNAFVLAHGFSKADAHAWMKSGNLHVSLVPHKICGRQCSMLMLDHSQRREALIFFRNDARYHPCAWAACECHDQ